MTGGRVGVLFVCLGNICRSPLAKWVLVHQAQQRGVLDALDIDSCGTGHWHIGKAADARSVEVARRYGLATPHCARQIDAARDFKRFHWIIAMDRDNRDGVLSLGTPAERVHLLRRFDPDLAGEPEHRLEVPDPYYGGAAGFEEVYAMVYRACEGLLERILEDLDAARG